jgi:hypothetical protein
VDRVSLAHKLTIAIGVLSALAGVWLLTSPVLLDEDDLAELGTTATDPGVLSILRKGSLQIAGLSLGWGLLVVGLAGPALLRGDPLAYTTLWLGGVGGATIASWPTLELGVVEVLLAFPVPVALAVSLTMGYKRMGSGAQRGSSDLSGLEIERR